MTRVLVTTISACLMALLASAAHGQDFPTKTVRMIASGAGGGGDTYARLIAQGLNRHYPHQVIVDNRGIIGIEIAAKAVPDGYTLLVYGSTVWMQPLLRDASRLGSDPRFRAHHLGDQSAQCAGGASIGAGQIGQGTDRAREGEARRAQLFVGRDRHVQPSCGGAFQCTWPASISSRIPYKSSATRNGRPARRTGAVDFRRGGVVVGQHMRSGKAARHGGDHRRAFGALSKPADDRIRGRAGL